MQDQKVTKRYSQALKQKVIADIEEGKYNPYQASRYYGISDCSVRRWIKQRQKNHLLTKQIRIQMPKEIDKIKQLEKEKKALESALAQTQLKLINAEATLEIYQEEYGIEVKKNYITGSLSVVSKKDKAKKTSR